MPTKFRPCIDLHDGQVKQIVGASLSDSAPSTLKTNFVASQPPAYYSHLYRDNNLTGAHVIKLGANNDAAAREALAAWPNGLQVGGGITADNAQEWLDAGAEKVILTSWLFPNAKFDKERLLSLVERVGKGKIVIDVSCKRHGDKWIVAMNKWQTPTDMEVNEESISMLSEYCSEFLVHAADVEGLCQGIDEELVTNLGKWCHIPCTYAGGGKDISDLALAEKLSGGKVDLTYGSALDIFGGSGVKFADAVAWNRSRE
ncbi:Enzyme that catalyzes the fourth step in the histidine pathway [Rhizophlyctis rosea]|uniref:1-(5-phosphoribosyl)-5-[(5-phosphoribosylamino)methylideneamino] imidazole-4-carboxamide isomerase n=1 Tax=Rhizophlyctis rosea TaxID=64517 RepID=A0AAD5SJK1_9FUNG|nr:Enzyme that catalyzes the fourth step in the histidine pathway [Rhizophlyctis rosea]